MESSEFDRLISQLLYAPCNPEFTYYDYQLNLPLSAIPSNDFNQNPTTLDAAGANQYQTLVPDYNPLSYIPVDISKMEHFLPNMASDRPMPLEQTPNIPTIGPFPALRSLPVAPPRPEATTSLKRRRSMVLEAQPIKRQCVEVQNPEYPAMSLGFGEDLLRTTEYETISFVGPSNLSSAHPIRTPKRKVSKECSSKLVQTKRDKQTGIIYLERENMECIVGMCRESFSSVNKYQDHLKTFHNMRNSHTSKETVECPVNGCLKKVGEGSLVRHILTAHLHASRVVCSFCQRGYTRRESLQSHIKKKHGNGT